jgi:transportin-1
MSISPFVLPVSLTLGRQKLNNFTRAPDYIAYLAYILTAMPGEEDRIRTIAGYLLKNNSRLILTASADVVAYVKTSVLQAFNDPSNMIRNAAGQDIVAFLGVLEPKNWPECLQELVNSLDSTDPERQEVSNDIRIKNDGTSRLSFFCKSKRHAITAPSVILNP